MRSCTTGRSSSIAERAVAALLVALTLAARPVSAQVTASTTTPAGNALPLYTYPGFTFHVSLDTVGVPVTMALPPALAFSALRYAYADLHVPLTLDDSAAGWLGTLHLIRTQSLGTLWLSQVVDCGVGMTGPIADNARVQLAIVSFVGRGTSDSTATVRTALLASAQSLGGQSSDRVLCTSRGALEAWIRSRITARTGRR
jgi:hypothetical protein